MSISNEYFKRNHIRLTDVMVGDILIADAGFSCIEDQKKCRVLEDKDKGLYILCSNGKHFLDGQTDTIGDLVGLVLKPEVTQ